jgi:hypothetical protein
VSDQVRRQAVTDDTDDEGLFWGRVRAVEAAIERLAD